MRKFLHITGAVLAVAFVLAFFQVPFEIIYNLPSHAVVTQSDLKDLTDLGVDFQLSGDASDYPVGTVDGAKKPQNMAVKLFGVIPVRNLNVEVSEERLVTPGGVPIGFKLQTDGVIVIGINDVVTREGKRQPTKKSNIARGDILTEVDGIRIVGYADIDKAMQGKENQELSVKLLRNKKVIETVMTPALDAATNRCKLGLWVRDCASGIGTLTFVKDDLRFGSLGHPIADTDTGVILPVAGGDVYTCSIVGVTKGCKGRPGDLKGVFINSSKPVGDVDKNNLFGVYGSLNNDSLCGKEKMPVGSRLAVKTGKAKIRATIGGEVGEYDIEIVKTTKQKQADEKSMIIKVTDKRLLEKTGGIVQGMSGSPIIQNGKVVGAVTHVFINDPTKGYGLYLDWMVRE